MDFKENKNFNPKLKKPPILAALSTEDRKKIIEQNPQYGKIICRCEQISEGEIKDALNSPLKVFTVDAIKRRVRAGAGRCHGGFCTPHILKIISEEQNIKIEDITKKGVGSELVQPIETFRVFNDDEK